jgi:tetratricopeptide (TPR) repeat protein
MSTTSTRLLVLALGIMLCPLSPLGAQAPGIIEPFDNEGELYLRANRYFKYGNDSQDLDEKRRALKMSIPLFREYLNTDPLGNLAQQASYQLAMALLLTGEREMAELTFSAIIQRYRTGNWVAQSAYRLAAQLYNRQDWARAAPYFAVASREATEKDLGHKSIFYESRCLKFDGKIEQAIKRLEQIVNDPSNPFREYARLAIGELHAEAGDHEKALVQFEILLAPNTAPQERAKALLAAGVSASKLGQHVKAKAFLNQTIDSVGLDPKYKAEAQLALMEMRFNEKNYTETVKVFRRGEFVGERDVLAKLYLIAGHSLYKLDRHNEAIQQFFNAERLGVSVKPEPLAELGFEAAYYRLSSFYKINGANIPAQVDAFVKIYAETHPANSRIHKARLMKAETLFQQGALTLASVAYNAIVVSALPEEVRADVYFKRGWCLSDSGEYGRAAQNLSSFIANYPDHAKISEALAKRGHAYLQIGDRASALSDFKRLLERKPEATLASFAHQNSGRIHYEEQRWPEMIAGYEGLLAVPGSLDNRSRADSNYWLGWGYYKLEAWAKAIPHLEAARDLMPQRYREPAGVHLVLAAYSLLDSDKLKEAVERLMVDAPRQRAPTRMLIWLGLERFSKGDYEGSDRFLGLASTPEEPSLTDVIVWRHLAKARIERKSFESAVEALKILIAQKQEDFWQSDAHLDLSHALIGLEKWKEAREAAHAGLALAPQGTVQAGLYMALADIAMTNKDFESAANSYLRTSEMFIGDKEIKPLALFRAAEALEKNDQPDEASRIRKQLLKEFPNWTAAYN